MKGLFVILLLSFAILGCNKFEVTEELPDIENIDAANMDSGLDRINITVDPSDWVSMYYYYTENVEINGSVEYHDANGTLVFNKNATLRIKGASSRHHAMRSLGMIFNDPIDNQNLKIIAPNIALNGDNLNSIS